MQQSLAIYDVTDVEGRILINLLNIEPRIDVAEILPWYMTKEPVGYIFEGKIFDPKGGSYHVRIEPKNHEKTRYNFIFLHYDSPNHYTRFIPASESENNNGNIRRMKKTIEQAISAIRDKNSDIVFRKVVKRQKNE